MSPSSMLESAMIWDQEAPLAHASTRPAGNADSRRREGSSLNLLSLSTSAGHAVERHGTPATCI